MNILVITLLFILGTIFGSFGGVLISRKWDKKWIKSIFFGRSKCDNCKKELSSLELIPILSFLFQKWKCSSCWKKLSDFYWIVELLSGLVFVLTYLFFPYNWTLELVFWIAINWSFLFLIIFDIQKHELHLPIRIFVTIVSLIFALLKLEISIIIYLSLGFVFTFIMIYLFAKYYVKLRFRKNEEWFGQWDVYLSLTIGIISWLIFHYNSINFSITNLIDFVIIYVILSSVIGLIYSVFNLFVNIKQKQIIPFVPAMICAFWILLLFGPFFIDILQ